MSTAITVPIQGTAHDAAYFQLSELSSADIFVCAYTDGPHAYSVPTIQSIRAAGHGVLWNHERGQLDLAGGFQAGVTAASEATPPVIAAGTPMDGSCGIVYSVDGSVASGDFPKYIPAFQAIRQVHAGRFLVIFYGELALFKYLKSLGLVDGCCWLSGSSSFPGYNPNDPDVGLVQQVGTDIPNTDKDLVTNLNGLGVWMTQVDLTPAAVAQIASAVAGSVWGTTGLELAAEPGGKLDPNWSVNVPVWEVVMSTEAQFYEVKNAIAGEQAALLAAINSITVDMSDVDIVNISGAIANSLQSTLPPAVVAAIAQKLGAAS